MLSRNQFVKGVASLFGMSALEGCRCPLCGFGRPKCAAQLYSIHKIFWQKPEWCLEGLKAAGYDGVEFAGFGWMLVLFGVEHMRWDLGAARGCVFIAEGVFAGLAYGLLAKRFGILSAIVAHAVTNLILGVYVIGWDKWFYW